MIAIVKSKTKKLSAIQLAYALLKKAQTQMRKSLMINDSLMYGMVAKEDILVR
jgi:hypothetical protein